MAQRPTPGAQPSEASTSGTAISGTVPKGARLTGDRRDALAGQLAERYAAGESIRSLSDGTGRSYGFVHGVLRESGVALRGRGGATRGVGREKARAVPSVDPALVDDATSTVKAGRKADKKAAARAGGKKDAKAEVKTAAAGKAAKKGSKKASRKS